MDWFRKVRYRPRHVKKEETVTGLWTKCLGCEAMLPKAELKENLFVCTLCGHHHRIGARARIKMLVDANTFDEHDARMTSTDALGFVDEKPYRIRLDEARAKSEERDAVIIGYGLIDGVAVAVGVMNFDFMGGSMGSVVGEKVARLAERATADRRPLVLVTASGGARMQEGMLSLMQMAKTVGAVSRHRRAGLLSASVLTDPTTGGTTASFATVTDIILAEPGALIAFAGPRVIEQTIRQKLPDGFQRSEFLMSHGLVDKIVKRNEIRPTLSRLFRFAQN
jgi:acetyl-CoA carboxylase carboxyl transferase subunit beta